MFNYLWKMQQLKEFILSCEQKDDIFDEEKNSGLSIASQSVVNAHIFDFIKSKYTCNVESDIVEDVCKAAVELFESLEHKGSTIGGIVSQKPYFINNKLLFFHKY